MSNNIATIGGHTIHLADPVTPPKCNFVGRKEELALCRVAWGVDEESNRLTEESIPLHFRLHGPPGVGKNEVVYEIARQLGMPLHIIQGHEELTPEDLVLLLVPDSEASSRDPMGLVLRASPLATAIYEGGLFFFDEINRVPERALSPLSSALDGRQSIYSAMTGISIEPKNDEARSRFRFCCALNPGLSASGHVLPEYIEQRTLPVVQLDYLGFDDLREILKQTLECPRAFLKAFQGWYHKRAKQDMSIRQLLAMIIFVMDYQRRTDSSALDALTRAEPLFVGPEE